MKHEIAIMQCLWKHAPASCTEILSYTKLDIQEKGLYKILNTLQKKDIITIAEMRKNTEITNRKPIRLYAPLVTEIEYMAQQIESIPNYEADTRLPPLFQHLIRSVKKRSTIAILHEIIAEAEKNLE